MLEKRPQEWEFDKGTQTTVGTIPLERSKKSLKDSHTEQGLDLMV